MLDELPIRLSSFAFSDETAGIALFIVLWIFALAAKKGEVGS